MDNEKEMTIKTETTGSAESSAAGKDIKQENTEAEPSAAEAPAPEAPEALAPETPETRASEAPGTAENPVPEAPAEKTELPAPEAPETAELPAPEAPETAESPAPEAPEPPAPETPDPPAPEAAEASESPAPEAPAEKTETLAAKTAAGESTASSDTSAESKPKKSKKKGLIAAIIGLVAVAGCAGAYVYKAQDYKNRFIPGSEINEIDVSGMTVEEAEASVKEKVESYTLTVSFPGGTAETLTAPDLGYAYVSDGSIQAQMDAQNPYCWGLKYLGRSNHLTSSEKYSLDSAVLMESLENLPEFQEENYTVSTDAGMELGEDQQLTIVKETYGTQLNLDSVMEKIADEVELHDAEVTLDSSYYLTPSIYSDDAQLKADLEECNKLLKSSITLTLHDNSTYEIGPDQTIEWLALKEGTENYYYVDEEKLKSKAAEAAAAIAEADDCSYSSIQFKSTKRGTITIGTGSYGCTVDQEKEAAQLLTDVVSGEQVERKPNYSKEYQTPLGSTYVEVDLANQHVYFYKNGECIVSSACVSGTDSDASRRSDRGFFHVTRRNTDYTMHGAIDPSTGQPSYETFVNYAVFYNGGEALHDASWRSSFGGSIYKTNGSHGCINLPYSAAQQIYNNSYVGMPVIVF